LELLTANAEKPVYEQKRNFQQSLYAGMQDSKQRDNITIVGLKIQ